MAKHEFGIMQTPPQKSKRYDKYEPKKYGCISVDDDDLTTVAAKFDALDLYWHTIERPGKGLAYCGVTLIPPNVLPAFLKILKGHKALEKLKELTEQAFLKNRWMIHFGL